MCTSVAINAILTVFKITTVGSLKPVVASFLTIAAYTHQTNLITTHCGTDLRYRITTYIANYHVRNIIILTYHLLKGRDQI